MKQTNEKLVTWLFETKAVRVCPQDKPFWYTSGKIGPYYINTHFLYGSEEKANELLKTIDAEKGSKLTCPEKIKEITLANYKSDRIYQGLIDEMLQFIKDSIDINEVDYISGGERRDWFFSLVLADFLNKPHLTIYKDLDVVKTENGSVCEVNDLKGVRVLHIADLITEASSYERAWIPAIRKRNGELKWSVVVIDRLQGGAEYLKSENVASFAMVNIDEALFSGALDKGLISDEQYKMIKNYISNPDEAMKAFLKQHPEFMTNALNSDDKAKERAKLCLEKNFYDFKI